MHTDNQNGSRILSMGRLLLIAMAAILIATTSAEVPTYSGKPSGKFMRSWLLCGPFPLSLEPGETTDTIRIRSFYHDFLSEHGGERNLSVEAGQVETCGDISVTWTPYQSPIDMIDLDEAVSRDEPVVMYAYCEIESRKTMPCALALGSNDGVQVWMNGERVWDRPGGRGLVYDDDIIGVVLNPGRNTLLIKVEELGNIWQFACRLVPFKSKLVRENLQPFQVITDSEGQPHLKCILSEKLLDGVLEGATLTVLPVLGAGPVIWEGRLVERT